MSDRLLTIALIVLPLFRISAQETSNPCPRNQPAVVYHTKLESFLLFGGFCSETKKRLNDLWSYKDGEWAQVETILAPYARSGHALVYDERGNRLIVFGGKDDNGSFLSDTWSWNGEEWSLLNRTGPEARQSHRMVDTNQGVLLFGGSNKDGVSLADTWLLKGNSWQEIGVTKGPPARRQHTLSYDKKRGRTVLFGGFDRKGGEKIVHGDTWEFNGIKWAQMGTNPELARDHHATAFDSQSGSVILFGGYNEGYLGDTWAWNGGTWTELNQDGPARAGKPGMMYDSSANAIVLFGGGDAEQMHLMDFWIFDQQTVSWKAK